MLVDCKNKESVVTEGDIDKLIRDARERSLPVAVLVTRPIFSVAHPDHTARFRAVAVAPTVSCCPSSEHSFLSVEPRPAPSSRPLTLQGLITGGSGRTVILGATCYQSGLT